MVQMCLFNNNRIGIGRADLPRAYNQYMLCLTPFA